MDATVSEGWLDLKACNPTDVTYQLGFSFEGEHIVGTLRSSARPSRRYELFNERVAYWRDTNGQLHLSATVARRRLRPRRRATLWPSSGFSRPRASWAMSFPRTRQS